MNGLIFLAAIVFVIGIATSRNRRKRQWTNYYREQTAYRKPLEVKSNPSQSGILYAPSMGKLYAQAEIIQEQLKKERANNA